MSRKLMEKKSVSPAKSKADENNTSTMSRAGEASPLQAGYRPKGQTKKLEDSQEVEGTMYIETKNKKMLDRSPMNKGYQSPLEPRSPGQRSVFNSVHEDLNLKEKNKDLGSKGVLLAKPKPGAREASPGLVDMDQEEEPSSVFHRNMNKRKSTKIASGQINLSKSSIGEASPTLNRGGIQTRNPRSAVPESADFGNKSGHRSTVSGYRSVEHDYRYANSPNNPDNEDPVTNLDDEEDNFAPSQNTLTRHSKSMYNKNHDQGNLVPRKTKVLGLINEKSSPKAFMQAKPKNVNRLSNFLLANSKSQEQKTTTLDVNKAKAGIGSNSPSKNKFSRMAMAMLVSKGANCEDRIITKSMRGEESGGVVDLGTNTLKSKTKKNYEVKKFGGKKDVNKEKKPKVVYNPSQRLKSAKVIQAWWRDLLGTYKEMDKKVIKIQSAWRGAWYRIHLYDILYYTYLIKAFVERIMIPIRKKIGRDSFELLTPFAHNYLMRKNYHLIIKIQCLMRKFLANIKSNRKRTILRLEKFYLQRLLYSFRKIRGFAQNAESQAKKREKNVKNFLKTLITKMRLRIFHNLFFKNIRNIHEDLQRILYRIIMAKHFRAFYINDLRAYFFTWCKQSLAKYDKILPFACRILVRGIIKPEFDELIGRLRAKIPKGFKEKIMRRLLKNADKFKDQIIKHYLNVWKITSTRLAGEEFKGSLTTNLLFKTKKKLDFNNLLACFRLWRKNVLKISDIKPYIKGLPLLRKSILRKCWEKGIPKINQSVDGIKSRALKKMCMNFSVFQNFTLRRYLKKWLKIHHKIGRLQISGLFLSNFKRANESKIVYKMLVSRFADWRRKTTIFAFKNDIDLTNYKRNQIKAVNLLVNGYLKKAKRKAFEHTYPKVKQYLMDILRSRSVKSLFKSYNFLNKTCLRIYWNKFKHQKLSADKKELKNNLFRGVATKFSKGIIKKNMRLYFKRWIKNCPNVKEVLLKTTFGIDKLLNHCRRKTFSLPKKAWHAKLDKERVHEAIMKTLGFSKKFMGKKLIDYYRQWRIRSEKLRAQLNNHKLAANFMKTHLKVFTMKILEAKFKKWKQKPPARMTLHQIFMRNKKTSDSINGYISKKLHNLKRDVFNKLKKRNGNDAIMKAYMKLIDYFLNSKKIKKTFWLRKWYDRIRELQLKDIRQAIMKLVFRQGGVKTRNVFVGSYFFRWRNIARVSDKFDDHLKYIKICSGYDKIERFVKWRKLHFWFKLKKLLNLDTRGKVFLMVFKRAMRPRNSVQHCFEKWRRISDKLDTKEQEKNLKNKLSGAYFKKLAQRVERDKKIRCFRLWKNKPTFSTNTLLNITDGFNLACRHAKKKFCGLPFTLILRQKNYKKLFKTLVPAGSKLAKKFEKRQLKRCWDHWIIVNDKAKTDGFKLKIFEQTNGKFLLKMKLASLSKRIRWWYHLSKRRKFNYQELISGTKYLTKHVIKPHISPFLKNLKRKAEIKDKEKGLKSFITCNAGFEKTALRYKLRKWYRKMLTFDDKGKSIAVRAFKRYVIEKYYYGPVVYYWNKWLKAMVKQPISGSKLWDGIDLIRKYILKKQLKAANFLQKTKKHRSPFSMNKALMGSILPQCEKLNRRYFKLKFFKWKQNANKLATRAVEAKFFGNLYNKNQKALLKRLLSKKMRLWAANTKPQKEIDLRKVIWLENRLYHVVCHKYLTGFLPLLKDFSQKKFLRNCLMKNSRFHKKLLVPFLQKWRRQNQLLLAKEMKDNFNFKVIGKTFSFYHNKVFQGILKNRIRLWRRQKNALKEIEMEITPKFVGSFVKFNLLKNLPFFLKKLNSNKISSLKKDIAFGLFNKGGKMQKRLLRNYYKKWLDKIKEMEIKEFKTNIVKGFLRSHNTKRNKIALRKAFEKFKVKEKFVASKNLTPYAVGNRILLKFLKHKPWQKFKKECNKRNLKIPEGMSFTEALLRAKGNPYMAQAIVFRNMTFRPYFRGWKEKVQKLKLKDLEHDMFKRIFLPNARKKSLVSLRVFFTRWKQNTQKMQTDEMKKNLKLGLMKDVYANNTKMCKRHYFAKWSYNLKRWYDFLERVNKAHMLLFRRMYTEHWRQLYNRVMYKDAFDQTGVAKKIILNVINNTEKGSLIVAFKKWKKLAHNAFDLDLKRRVLQVFLKNQNVKGQYRNRFHLQDRFFLWKMRSTVSDYDKLGRIRKAENILKNLIRRPFIMDFLDRLGKKATANKLLKRLSRLAFKSDVNFKDKAKRKYFLLWRITVARWDKVLKEDFKRMMHEYAENHLHERQYTRPIRVLCSFFNRFGGKQDKAANVINKFLRDGLTNLADKLEKRKRTDLRYFLERLYKKENSKLKVNLLLWRKITQMFDLINATETIQNYLRKKIESLKEGRDRFDEASRHIKKHCDAIVFEKLANFAQKMRLRSLLLRIIKDVPDDLKKEFLKKAVARWINIIKREKMLRGVNIINNGVRRFFCMKIKKRLMTRKLKTNNIVLKLFGKYLDKLKIYFLQWSLKAKNAKIAEASTTIQTFFKQKLNRILNAAAFNGLKHRFIMAVWKMIMKTLQKSSKIKASGGLILMHTLKTIYYQRPFDKLKIAAIRIGNIKKLGNVYPKILNAFRSHYLPFYFVKWHKNAQALYLKRLIRVQNWMKGKFALMKAKMRARKEYLFFKYLRKMTRDNRLLFNIYLRLWLQRSKLFAIAKAATYMQKMWRGKLARKNLRKGLMKLKAKELFRKLILLQFNNTLVKSFYESIPIRKSIENLNMRFEKRYMANNIFDYANMKARNIVLLMLTNNQAYSMRNKTLRQYFEGWKRIARKFHQCAIRLQKNFLAHKAKKRMQKLFKVKEILLDRIRKYQTFDEGKIKILFLRWFNRMEHGLISSKVEKIQKYLRKMLPIKRKNKLAKLLHKYKRSYPTKFLNAGLLRPFYRALLRGKFKDLLIRLKKLNSIKKFLNIVSKRLSSSDKDMQRLYLKKVLNDYYKRVNMINVKRNAAALLIQSNFKKYQAINRLHKFIRKIKVVGRLKKQYESQLEVKFQLYFQKWIRIWKLWKFMQSTQLIQLYLRKVLVKARKLRKERIDRDITEGVEHMDNYKTKKLAIKAFESIKEKTKGNQFSKLNEYLLNKIRGNKKWTLDKIRDYIKMKHAAAGMIQKAYHQWKFSRMIWLAVLKLRKMKFIAKMMQNRDFRFVVQSLRLWQKRNLALRLVDGAKTLQLFLRQSIIKYKKQKRREAQKRLKIMVNDALVNSLLKVARSYNNYFRFEKAYPLVLLHIWKKFKYRILNFDRLKTCSLVYDLRTRIMHKILKYWFEKYQVKVIKLKKIRNICLIQKNFRIFRRRLLEKKVKKIMEELYKKYDLKTNHCKKYYFLRMWKIAFMLRTKAATDKVSKFTMKYLKQRRLKHKWRRTAESLCIKKGEIDGKLFLLQIKRYFCLQRLFEKSRLHIIKHYFLFKAYVKLKRLFFLLNEMLKDYRNRKNVLMKSHCFRSWKTKNEKMKYREAVLDESLLEVVKKRHYINSSIRLNDFFYWRNFLKFCRMIKAKHFFKKIKKFALLRTSIVKMGEGLNKYSKIIEKYNAALFYRSYCKAYRAKVLSCFTKRYEAIEKTKYIPKFAKYFLMKLTKLMYMNSKIKYNYQHYDTAKTRNNRKFKFSARVTADRDTPKEKGQQGDSSTNVQINLVLAFLTELFRKRKIWGFLKIKRRYLAHKFCEKIKIGIEKRLPNLEFMKYFTSYYLYKKETPAIIAKLKSLLRLYSLRRLFEDMNQVPRRVRLIYLLQLVGFEGEVLTLRFLRIKFRKWFVKTKQDVSVKKKMLDLYRTMHLQFLQMSAQMFGDKDSNNEGLFESLNQMNEKLRIYQGDISKDRLAVQKKHVKKVNLTYSWTQHVKEDEKLPEDENHEKESNDVNESTK